LRAQTGLGSPEHRPFAFFRRCTRGSSPGGATLPLLQIAVAGVSLHAIVPPRVDTLSELDAPPALAKERS
jgi:hypothetical protein